jgi:hypothetical protein
VNTAPARLRNFVRNFAELADLMRIYTSAVDFERALDAAEHEAAASTD